MAWPPQMLILAGAEAGADIGRQQAFPTLVHLRLDSAGLQGLHSGDAFDQERLAFGAAAEAFVDARPQQRCQDDADDHVKQDGDDHHGEQPWRIEPHDDQENDREQHVDDQGHGRRGQEFADRVQFADASDGIADAAGLEIGERQAQQVAVELGA